MDNLNNKKSNITLCQKKLWLDRTEIPADSTHYDLDGDYSNSSVRNIVYENIADGIRIQKDDPVIMAEETKLLIDNAYKSKRIVLCDAAFVFGEIVIYVDRLLLNLDGSMEICEIKAATHVKDAFIRDISYKGAVLTVLGYAVKRAYIGYVNGNYVKHGNISIKNFLLYKDVTKVVSGYLGEMVDCIERSMRCETEPECLISASCLSPYRCKYWDYCTKDLPQDNVFCVSGLGLDRKFELYNEGVVSFSDIEEQGCVSARQMEQVSSVLHSYEPIIHKTKLSEFLKSITFPLYFLDFETFQSAVPKYDGVMPFTQIPFQFSLHYIEGEGCSIRHTEFLAEHGFDPRRELAERLVKEIPDNACVVAYNMVFEKSVIKKLAFMFDDLYPELMKIHDNIKDLMVPFQKHYYYDRRMNGSHSLKAVLPALFPDDPELEYGNLELIHNGVEAMIMYQQAEDLCDQEREVIRNHLLEYCRLDTYAMVKIWQKLRDVAG